MDYEYLEEVIQKIIKGEIDKKLICIRKDMVLCSAECKDAELVGLYKAIDIIDKYMSKEEQ